MVERTFTVTGQLGLHARAAAKLVRVASGFESSLRLERKEGGRSADAKSILSVLMLAATCGTELRAIAEGPDEDEALDELGRVFSGGFGEASVARPAPTDRPEIRWKGLGVSEGIAIGRVLRMHNGTKYVYRSRLDASEIDRELRRFRAALRLARRQLTAVRERAAKDLGQDHAYVFDAHLLVLEDEKLLGDVERHISQEHANAEWAVRVVGDHLITMYSEIEDNYLRERESDIEDVVQRLLVALTGERTPRRKLSNDAVIVSQDLLPSAVAEMDFDHARAIATDTGGWTSHTAIIARGLAIPAVVGLRDFFRRARTGDQIIVDSLGGEVILHPSPTTVERYLSEVGKRATNRLVETPRAEDGPLRTLDGLEIRMRANVEVPAEFAGVRRYGARGIGLYRSEFLLSRGGIMVSEDDQYAAYAEIAKLAGDDGAIIRLFDLGGENASDLMAEPERNPALGLRAIRFGLFHKEIMRTQVRAILRAAAEGRVDIVLPMVADVGDVRNAKAMIEEERSRLENQGLRHGHVGIGAMIEVPSAVLTADKIAANVDFFELGTNDLVQYTLAVDRSSDHVARWFRTLHPSVLSSIYQTLNAAKQAGIPAIVCGEMASTPAYAALLVGLGAVDLSMTPASIPRVRRSLAGIDSRDAKGIVAECLECATADEVEQLVRERFQVRWAEIFPLESLPRPREEK
ncbi:MAG: phosphoenolpyruvate--protein phosphotransferase [Pyrinomonadaceae bacterium]|nr:phosphoenolpyruvate--protein phosphotransferase [Pyrinomonadaceae bacterium]